jgi:uncharacterized protein (TIGR03086 family)
MPEQRWDIIVESLDLLRNVGAEISTTNGDAPTPCREWSVTQVLQHAVADQLAWVATLGVGPMPSEDPFSPSGHLEGDVGDYIETAVVAARTAWAGVRPDDDAVPTPLPQGKLPARSAAAACSLDAAVHAWDIAMGLGRPDTLPDHLAAELLSTARVIVEPLRQFGVYAPALTPEPDDGAGATLLRYLGRDPSWRTPVAPLQ